METLEVAAITFGALALVAVIYAIFSGTQTLSNSATEYVNEDVNPADVFFIPEEGE